jgi:8-oxo-dGTP pyrophosphatase MutT (NUDIX family)
MSNLEVDKTLVKRRINVRGIIYREGKILVVRQKHGDGTPTDYLATPGGGVDSKEDLITAVKRELFEELGVEAKVGRLFFIQQYNDDNHGVEAIEMFFFIDNPEDFQEPKWQETTHGQKEIVEVLWVSPDHPEILPSVIGEVDIDKLATQVSPVIFRNYV